MPETGMFSVVGTAIAMSGACIADLRRARARAPKEDDEATAHICCDSQQKGRRQDGAQHVAGEHLCNRATQDNLRYEGNQRMQTSGSVQTQDVSYSLESMRFRTTSVAVVRSDHPSRPSNYQTVFHVYFDLPEEALWREFSGTRDRDRGIIWGECGLLDASLFDVPGWLRANKGRITVFVHYRAS